MQELRLYEPTATLSGHPIHFSFGGEAFICPILFLNAREGCVKQCTVCSTA